MSDSQTIDRFAAAGAAYRQALDGVTPELAKRRCKPGTWSILELVVHVVDADAVAIDRMKRVIAENRPMLLNFDEGAYIERLAPQEQSLDDALTLLEVGRRQFARVLRRLPAEALDRAGVHNLRGEVTARQLLEIIADHAEHHLEFLVGKRRTLGSPAPREPRTGSA